MSDENTVSVESPKGIKETTELLTFVLALAHGIAASLANGKVDIADLMNFWEPGSLAPAAFDGVAEIPSELSDLSGEEIDAIKAEISAKYPEAEKILDLTFNAATSLWGVIQWVKQKTA